METPRPCYGDIPHYRSHVPEEQDAVGQTEHRCMGIPVQGFHRPSPHGSAIPSEHETGIALLPLTAATTLHGNDAIPPRRGDGPLQRGLPRSHAPSFFDSIAPAEHKHHDVSLSGLGVPAVHHSHGAPDHGSIFPAICRDHAPGAREDVEPMVNWNMGPGEHGDFVPLERRGQGS